MSTRQTRYIFISTSSGVFSSIEDAIAAANAIKIWLQRLCMQKGYACQGTIGISQNNPKDGRVERKKTGKKGRPKNTFVFRSSTKPHRNVNPHLHVILKATPAHTIGKALVMYLINRFGRKAAQYKDCSDYADTAAEYLKKQCLKVRKITCNTGLFSFTNEFGVSAAESTENACNSDDAESSQTLHCNRDNRDIKIIESDKSKNSKRDYDRAHCIVLRSPISIVWQIRCKSGFY